MKSKINEFPKNNNKLVGKLNFLPAIIGAALMLSCGSDDGETYTAPQTYLVATETLTDLNDNSVLAASEFGYDDTNRVISEMSATESKTFVWGSNGKISKMTNGVGAPMRETIYTYNSNGALTGKQRNHPASGIVEARYEYTYFTDHYEEKYYTIDNELFRSNYYYTADKKNIEKVDNYYGTGSDFLGSKEFLYDNKTGVAALAPYSQLPEPFHNANNVVTTTYRNSSNVITSTSDTLLEYNGLGHPTTSTTGYIERSFDYIAK